MAYGRVVGLSLVFLACAGGPRNVEVPVAAIPSPSVSPASPPSDVTCDRAVAKLLSSFRGVVHADAYVTRGTPKLDAFAVTLDHILARFKGPHFQYRVIEATDEVTKHAAKEAGLVEQPLGEGDDSGTSVSITSGFVGIAFTYGETRDAIRFIDPSYAETLDFWIANKMRDLRAREEHVTYRYGVLTGHGEMGLSEPNLVAATQGEHTMQGVLTQNFPSYHFEDVDLAGGARAIDAGLDGLIVTQPEGDVGDAELRRIDDFVMQGKSLAVFASAVNVKASDAAMQATLDAHRLDRLLGGYGMELRRDAVIDIGSPVRVVIGTAGGGARASFPAFLEVVDERVDATFPPLWKVGAIAVPFASSIVLHAEKQPGAKLRAILRTTPKAQRLTLPTLSMSVFQKWPAPAADDSRGEAIVGASADGTLTSAFGSAPSTKRARVLLIASSQFTANPLARAGNPLDEKLLALANPYAQAVLTATILVVKNTLDWMVLDEGLSACALPHGTADAHRPKRRASSQATE